MTAAELQDRLRRSAGRDPVLRQLRSVAADRRAELWLVGGYVRDAALRRSSKDLDLVCTGGTARLVAALREAWSTGGFRFRKRGVTTWRFSVADGRIDLVDAARRGLDADLRRRELRINAIAFDLAAQRLHDPLGGLADLRAGRLRLPAAGVMKDDPVRALRAARFLATLPHARLDPAARAEARSCARALRRASVERVREELDKLLAAAAPRRGLDALVDLELLAPLLPELEPLRHCVAGRDRPDVWTHTLDAIELTGTTSRLPGSAATRAVGGLRLLRWSLLLHDISKPETLAQAPDGRPTFHGHEVLGARRADALLRRLRGPGRERKRIARLIRQHLRPGHLADADNPPRGLRRLVREAADDLPLLAFHAACDARASGSPDAERRWRRLSRTLRTLLEMSRPLPKRRPRLIDGRDVMRLTGLTAGPAVGELLDEIRELQQAGRLHSRDDALAYLRERPAG